MKLLKKINPAVVFIKGGFVGLPVGLAAAKLKIPYITHDSDAIPGLANRIIAKWASLHAVAMPKHLYSYPQDKTVYVGVPISSDFVKVDDKLKKSYRQQLGLSPDGRIVMVTGGGLGAQRLNQAVETSAGQILTDYPDLVILHLTGSVLEASTKEYYESNLSPKQLERVRVVGFTNQLYLYSGAADVVISRAGATNMSEFAAQAKACIIMPNPILTGGHQTKNAQHLQDNGAIRVVTEDEVSKDSNALTAVIKELLEDQALRSAMAEKLHHYHKPSAAADLANQILGLAGYEV